MFAIVGAESEIVGKGYGKRITYGTRRFEVRKLLTGTEVSKQSRLRYGIAFNEHMPTDRN